MASINLQAFEIESWQLRHPERLQGFDVKPEVVTADYQLLLVAQQKPQGEDVFLLSKILATMNLTLEQVCFVDYANLTQISAPQIQWIWLVDAEGVNTAELDVSEDVKWLQSAPLSQMHTNADLKRELWQQIRRQLEQ